MATDAFQSDSQSIHSVSNGIVTRKAQYWSPAVGNLLQHLNDKGFPYAPRYLGLQIAAQTEQLGLIPGQSGKDIWAKVVSDEGLVAFAKLLRAYHDAVADYRPSGKILWAYGERELQPDEILCHNDFGPWNTVWQAGKPVGIIDWDLAGPGKPIDDIAYALEYVAPFRDDAECTKWLAYPAPPDRKHRIATFLEAYGLDHEVSIVNEVIRLQELDIEHVKYLAGRGLEPQKTWIHDGYLDELQKRVDWTRQNRHLFE